MVAQQYGPQVRSDVISDAVQSTFADAIREQNLRIAGSPRIEPKTRSRRARPARILGDLRDLSGSEGRRPLRVTIERPQARLGPEDIERTIEMLRRQRTRYEHVTARPAATAIASTVDFNGKIGRRRISRAGRRATSRSSLGEARMLPEFEAAVAGMSAGETKTFALTFPADYHGKEVAGKDAEFTLTVKSCRGGPCPTSMPNSRRRSASRAAASTTSRPRSRRT